MYRNIIVPLDGSETAEQVLPYVRDLVRGRTVTVHLISVAPLSATAPVSAVAPLRMYPLVVSRADFEAQTQERNRIESELRNYLNGVAMTLAQGNVATSVEVRFGEPAEEILALQSEVRADLIAMCTHGRTGLARWAYGSVAEKVTRHADCPVLLVRARKTNSSASRS
ncbi:MAG TPA: universal stress protein [Anaerolineae bacterium]|nr:universal stress protein [Anaerolineae bacterium]